MSRDDIIRLAREAGVFTPDGHCVTVTIDLAERFAALVAAHERELCAKVCEQAAPSEPNCVWSAAYKHVSDDIAAAIRARGNP